MSQLIWAVCNGPVGFGMDLGCHWRLGRLHGPRIVLSAVRHGGVLPGECFWAPPMRNIMKPQGDCPFPRLSAKTLSGGRAWNVLGLFSGACRCLGENEGDSQVSQKLKTLEQSQKRPHAIIIRGAHDNCSHGSKCLMGLRPGGGAWLIAAPNYPSTARIRPSLSDSASHQD